MSTIVIYDVDSVNIKFVVCPFETRCNAMPNLDPAPVDLKEACIVAAREVIAEQGVEGLSLRDVARKLGVSHQAPYRHYPSRDHLLAEIMRRCFEDFATHLDQGMDTVDADASLEAMGRAYLAYAQLKPLEYRLMFGTPWPEPAQHPELVRHALHAFNLLRHGLRRKHGDVPTEHARADQDAMFIWSALHGMASIAQANVMQHLDLAPQAAAGLEDDLMHKIGAALAAPHHPLAAKAAKAAKRSRP